MLCSVGELGCATTPVRVISLEAAIDGNKALCITNVGTERNVFWRLSSRVKLLRNGKRIFPMLYNDNFDIREGSTSVFCTK